MIEIRQEGPRDRDEVLEVERLAFGSDEESHIVEAVRDEPGSFALVAEEDGAVLGHVQFSRAWIGKTSALALGPIGVRPEHQGRGIGSHLIRAGLEEARARGEVAVILLGSPAFYPRFGFEPGSRLGLSNPFAGVRPDGFQIAEEDFMVAAFGDEALAGEVRWHPSFGEPVEGTASGA